MPQLQFAVLVGVSHGAMSIDAINALATQCQVSVVHQLQQDEATTGEAAGVAEEMSLILKESMVDMILKSTFVSSTHTNQK